MSEENKEKQSTKEKYRIFEQNTIGGKCVSSKLREKKMEKIAFMQEQVL